ncbi:unnamed protein product [Sphacelaria rigidula]
MSLSNSRKRERPLPKGKSLNAIGRLNAVQRREIRKKRTQGYKVTRRQWMMSEALSMAEK